MSTEDPRATAMLEEIASLRARIERLRSLPDDAFYIEGILVEHDHIEPSPGSVHEVGTIVSTIGSWRFEQFHEGADTARWSTRVTLTPLPDEEEAP